MYYTHAMLNFDALSDSIGYMDGFPITENEGGCFLDDTQFKYKVYDAYRKFVEIDFRPMSVFTHEFEIENKRFEIHAIQVFFHSRLLIDTVHHTIIHQDSVMLPDFVVEGYFEYIPDSEQRIPVKDANTINQINLFLKSYIDDNVEIPTFVSA